MMAVPVLSFSQTCITANSRYTSFPYEPRDTGDRMGKIVKTSFGAVDGQALEKLQDSFDTTELLRAVDAMMQLTRCAIVTMICARTCLTCTAWRTISSTRITARG